MSEEKIAIQDLPPKCKFIHLGELLSNGYGDTISFDERAYLRGEPYCTVRCTNGYAVYCDLPGETLVTPVSVGIGCHDMPWHLYQTRIAKVN